MAETRSSRPSLLASKSATPKPSNRRLATARPTAAVASVEIAPAQIAVERGRLAIEVGDGQVDQSVAIEVAGGDAHARLVGPGRVAGHPGSVPDLLEPHSAHVAEQEIGGRIVGDKQIELAIVVEIGGDDPKPAAAAVDNTSLSRNIDESAPVIAEQMIGQGLGVQRIAINVGVLDSLRQRRGFSRSQAA